MRMGTVPVGTEDELLAIAGEHGKTVESTAVGDTLKAGAILFDHEQIECSAFGIEIIRGKDDMLAIGRPIGGKTCSIQMRDLPLVRPIGIHHKNFELGRLYEPLLQQIAIFCKLITFRTRSAIDNFTPVRRKICASIITSSCVSCNGFVPSRFIE